MDYEIASVEKQMKKIDVFFNVNSKIYHITAKIVAHSYIYPLLNNLYIW